MVKKDENDWMDLNPDELRERLKEISKDKFKQLDDYDLDKNIPKNKKISKLNEDIKRLLDKKEIEEAREDPILPRTNNGIYNKSRHTFFKVLAFLGWIVIVGALVLWFFTPYGKDIIHFTDNSTMICEPELNCPNVPSCPECPDCSLDCGNMTNYINNIIP